MQGKMIMMATKIVVKKIKSYHHTIQRGFMLSLMIFLCSSWSMSMLQQTADACWKYWSEVLGILLERVLSFVAKQHHKNLQPMSATMAQGGRGDFAGRIESKGRGSQNGRKNKNNCSIPALQVPPMLSYHLLESSLLLVMVMVGRTSWKKDSFAGHAPTGMGFQDRYDPPQ